MKDKLYKILPHPLQNLLVTLFNILAYKKRYGGKYKAYREEKLKNRTLTLEELEVYQKKRFKHFIEFVIGHSTYYGTTIGEKTEASNLDQIRQLPIVDKEILRANITSIVASTSEPLSKSKTGGTTGKSLEVQNFYRNVQERFAFLDDFRSRFGYELGKKTAWFSGKSLLTDRDLKKQRFWKTDFYHKVRYYSTFHIKQDYLKYYVENLMEFKPEYMVGFPSTMLEIAKYGLAHHYDFPANTVKAVFPTAETITPSMRKTIETFFKTKIYNQYASSEGAPFILECENGNLHLELQSGVFEVLDENNSPTQSGRLVVTSFINEGTPLIRYDIGDAITLEESAVTCTCGNNNPLVKEILGRKDDFIYSPENGKINLGNISNTLKGVYGIKKFQVVQDELNALVVKIIKEDKTYTAKSEKIFIQNWRDRIGSEMKLSLQYVENIPVEKSGKYRIIKNNVKHLLSDK